MSLDDDLKSLGTCESIELVKMNPVTGKLEKTEGSLDHEISQMNERK